MGFKAFALPSALKQAIDYMKFEVPTPIQTQAIPLAMEGRDLLGCAQTGSGKTAAFAIPLITRLLKSNRGVGLILVPTRELAQQVTDVIGELARFIPEMKPVVIIGGVAMDKQVRNLKKHPRIIIATPGRLVDHLHRRTTQLNNVEMLILDEADRMLDIGFAPQLNEILKFLPAQRQTLMFSATVSKEIEKLTQKYLHEPERVTIASSETTKPDINQKVLEIEQNKKNEAMLDALNERQGSVLVFARTQSRTDRLARFLESYGVSVARIHGGRSQGQRNRALDGFRDGEVRVLVATDIAARGIDIDHVAHVINYDLPQVPEDYVHRIGRTGRAGRKGEALSFVTREDRAMWRAIHRLLYPGSAAAAGPHEPTPSRHQQPRGGSGGGRPRGGGGGNRSSRGGGGGGGRGGQRSQRPAHQGAAPIAAPVIRPQDFELGN